MHLLVLVKTPSLSIGRIVSQHIHISNHHNVHFKYLTILFVKHTLINLAGESNKNNFFKKTKYIPLFSL